MWAVFGSYIQHVFSVHRKWVAFMVSCTRTLLMTTLHGSSESQWFSCWSAFGLCWWCVSSVLQRVSGFCSGLHLDPAHDAILGSSVGDCLPLWVASRPCWWHLSLALQEVSCCCLEPHLITWQFYSWLQDVHALSALLVKSTDCRNKWPH